MTDLTGHVAVVTGAAQGLGRAFADALRAAGADIVACDRRDAVHDIEGLTYVADIRNADEVRMVVDGAVAKHGRVDVLVNNAGVVRPTFATDPWEQALADYDEIVETNLRGSFLFGRAVTPVMVEGGGGNIVNIGTDHVFPLPGVDVHGHGAMDLYNASKWAINGLTLDWAISLKRHGIRVNAIHMGATDTEMLRTWMGDKATDDVVRTWMQPTQTSAILLELLGEGPTGRTGQNVGLWVGRPPSIDDATHAGARLPAP